MTERPDRRTEDVTIGTLLLGRYRVVRKLATGGMGVVYLARVEGAAGFVKPVVVKRILPAHAEKRDYLGMFIREARILSRLRDPGIVDVIEFAEERGAHFLVLEYVHGFQLREWLNFLKAQKRRIPTDVAIQILINVLDALHHAHSLKDRDGTPHRIIHRDISPANILLDVTGRVKLVDFGIARMSGESTHGYNTVSNTFRGKLSYAAPELLLDDEASVRSDVYACGVTLHEILIGTNEFLAESEATTIDRVAHHAPSSVTKVRDDVPPRIDAVIANATTKDPDRRYSSAGDFADALRAVVAAGEREILERLGSLVKADFQDPAMAEILGVDSLESRESAWRLPSEAQAQIDSTDAEERTEAMRANELPLTIAAVDEIEGAPAGSADTAPRKQMVVPIRHVIWVAAVVLLSIAGIGVALAMWAQGNRQPDLLLVESQTKSTDGKDKFGAGQIPLADQSGLTGAFGRNKEQIFACLKRHPGDMKKIEPKLSVFFKVAPTGDIEEIRLVPERAMDTALGRCILDVARLTKFPKPTEQISFQIPLTLHHRE